jgi:Isy1-like splicing family
VKELFESRKKEEDEENATSNFYKKFMNQGPAYFGDLDEGDGNLLKYEEEAEQTGNVPIPCLATWASSSPCLIPWRQSGRRRTLTCVKSLTFLLIYLHLKYRAAQARPHPASRHRATLHPHQMANARPRMTMAN